MSSMSKSRTLEFLQDRVKLFSIPKFISFGASNFSRNPEDVLKAIAAEFPDCFLAVRSSAANEDGIHETRAGEYDSILNVSSKDSIAVRESIDAVLASYDRLSSGVQNEVIVQEMLIDTIMSGVVFTHDLNTGAPYYVINYDDISGLTNTVTAGEGQYSNRTLYIHRSSVKVLRSERFQRLIEAIQELELLLGSQFLDIEFALGVDYAPYLLQARSITTSPNWNRAVVRRIDAALNGAQDFLANRLRPIIGIYGASTVLGQMPDWNPAEMIGRAPRALSFSMYKTLITDEAWRIARAMMGYGIPSGQPLMVSLMGQPFIDTRLSFNSYLPAGLPGSICEKLVNSWVQKLRDSPELHDKVEFEVAITTYSFDIDERIHSQTNGDLTECEKSEFKVALHQQLCDLIKGDSEGSIGQALAKLEVLKKRQSEVDRVQIEGAIEPLFQMVSECINYGTVPFAILARHGFIARTLLDSLEKIGILSKEEINNFQLGVKTIAGELVNDMNNFRAGKLSRASFMSRYGHLRPGTYDILSLRYDQMHNFMEMGQQTSGAQLTNTFELNASQIKNINALLLDHNFVNLDVVSLFEYIRSSIVGREYGKFVFTRTVSDILEVIARYGEKNGLSREELSHISLESLLEGAIKSGESSDEERLRQISEHGREQHALSSAIRFPQVLFDEAGVHIVPFQVSHPNFITNKKISATCVYMSTGLLLPDLTGKIALIENADPGFDWIFSQKIGGLITKYGGANSHMAIRCAEFGIPAAIGCGEQRFEVLIKSSYIALDCAAGLINPLG